MASALVWTDYLLAQGHLRCWIDIMAFLLLRGPDLSMLESIELAAWEFAFAKQLAKLACAEDSEPLRALASNVLSLHKCSKSFEPYP